MDSLYVSITTIATSYIIGYFNLGQMFYGILYNGIFSAIKQLSTDKAINWQIMIFSLICGTVYLVFIKRDHLVKLWYRDCECLIVSNYNEIVMVLQYIHDFPDYFGRAKLEHKGNNILHLHLVRLSCASFHRDNAFDDLIELSKLDKIYSSVPFHDTKYGIEGWYKWRTERMSIPEGNNMAYLEVPYMEITIRRHTVYSIDKYFNEIVKHFESRNESTLYHITEMDCRRKIDKSIMYKGEIRSEKVLKTIYLDSFFHPQKDMLWNLVWNIQNNPMEFYKLGQQPRANFLLYGPPGTGKSSFAYRLAMLLNRHVRTLYLKPDCSKEDVIVNLEKNMIGKEMLGPSKAIYVIDELDSIVKELYDAQKQISNSETISLVKEIHDNDESDDEDNKKKNKNIMKNKLQLNDLLEIFQGPVPLTGGIVIATTNRYNELVEMLPALFRDGRLTPIKFDYFDDNMMNKFCQHYFDENWLGKIQPMPISFLTEQVCQIKLNPAIKDKYGEFKKRVTAYGKN